MAVIIVLDCAVDITWSRVTRCIQTVVIVDTSNEIAGEGTVPHREAIGESRRLMVASKENQYK